jgi:hypothetical protein
MLYHDLRTTGSSRHFSGIEVTGSSVVSGSFVVTGSTVLSGSVRFTSLTGSDEAQSLQVDTQGNITVVPGGGGSSTPIIGSPISVTVTSSLSYDFDSYDILDITVNAPISESIFSGGLPGKTYRLRHTQAISGGSITLAKPWISASAITSGQYRLLGDNRSYRALNSFTASSSGSELAAASWSLHARVVGDNVIIASNYVGAIDILEVYVESSSLYLVNTVYD